MIIFISSCVSLVLLFTLIRFLHKVWWTPIRLQRVMRSQGIKGPSYRFLHGNTKEIISMTSEAASRPMDLSHDIFPRLQPHVYTWIKLYGNNFLNWYGPQAQLVITEPDMIKEILSDKGGAYPKSEIPSYVKKLIGEGLVSSKGEKWSKLRKIANHSFYTESLKLKLPAMTTSVEAMLERWRPQESKVVEVFDEFRVLTSEIISRTAFGSSYEEGKNTFEMLQELGVIIQRNTFRIRLPLIGKFVKTQDDIESDRLEKAIGDSIISIIKRREEKVATGEATDSDFLGALLRAHHDPDEKKRISVEEIIDECKTFYSAGQDTTTSLLAWTVLLLAIDTDWQEKARKEVLELFGYQTPTPEGIARFKTMNMIINESLRLYSPALNIVRQVKKETTVGKLTIPANVDLHIVPLALHHNPQIWGEDVHLFKPERFAEGVAKAAVNGNSMALIPFGFGPRFCVGMNFATTEAKIALSMILQRYKFTLSPTYVHSPAKILTVRPGHGVPLILHKI